MGTDWNPTPEEARMHDLFDQLGDLAEELGMNRDVTDVLFNTFYNALEEQGKMSNMMVTEEELQSVRAALAAKLGIEPPAPVE